MPLLHQEPKPELEPEAGASAQSRSQCPKPEPEPVPEAGANARSRSQCPKPEPVPEARAENATSHDWLTTLPLKYFIQ